MLTSHTMDCQMHTIEKAIRHLFTALVKIILEPVPIMLKIIFFSVWYCHFCNDTAFAMNVANVVMLTVCDSLHKK